MKSTKPTNPPRANTKSSSSERESLSLPSHARLSGRYRAPIRRGVIRALGLGLVGSVVIDQGVWIPSLLAALAAYTVMLLLIILRRPQNPTKLDCTLIATGVPLLFTVAIGVRLALQ